MRTFVRSSFAVVGLALVGLALAACGGDGSGSSPTTAPLGTSSTVATITTVATAAGPSTTEQEIILTTSTAPLPSVPTTLVAEPGDLLDPASWIGHRYAEEQMADPFQHVILDGTVTDFITMRYGTTTEPDQIGYPAFVRPDPGGYGYSGTEPGPWVVLAWRPADPTNWPAGGNVQDALLATAVENEMPMSGCRSIEGVSGVFLGFVIYDPTYIPDGTETAPFPVTKAWRITDDLELESVAAEGIACDWYEFGD